MTVTCTRHDDRPVDLYGQPLTPFERWLLRVIATGATEKRISRYLRVGSTTMQRHLSRVYRKLGAASRVEAVVLAHRRGDIDVGQPFELPDLAALMADRDIVVATTARCNRAHSRLPEASCCVTCLVIACETRRVSQPDAGTLPNAPRAGRRPQAAAGRTLEHARARRRSPDPLGTGDHVPARRGIGS